jgi:hypothetical protein
MKYCACVMIGAWMSPVFAPPFGAPAFAMTRSPSFGERAMLPRRPARFNG